VASSGSLDAFLTFGPARTATKTGIQVKGETEDTTEKGYGSCQLTQYNLGFSLDTAPGTETDNKAGDTATHAPELKPVQVTKSVDTASPLLMQLMSQAALFADVWIWQKKAGASKKASGGYFWKVHLKNVHISDLTWTADSDSLTETLTLNYQKIKVEYYRQLSTGDLEQKAIPGEYPEPGAKLSVVKSKTDTADAGQIEQRILTKLQRLNPGLKLRIS
jgi:type VI protein secretion system component Hcp